MSRDDLLVANPEERYGKYCGLFAASVLVLVTNPLDAMCTVAHHVSRISQAPRRGYGWSAGFPYFRFIAMELGILSGLAVVLGGHGDTMVPVVRLSNVSGIPLTELIPADRLAAIVDRTRNGGAEIVKHLKTEQRVLRHRLPRLNGGVDPQGQEESAPLRGFARRRVRRSRIVRSGYLSNLVATASRKSTKCSSCREKAIYAKSKRGAAGRRSEAEDDGRNCVVCGRAAVRGIARHPVSLLKHLILALSSYSIPICVRR